MKSHCKWTLNSAAFSQNSLGTFFEKFVILHGEGTFSDFLHRHSLDHNKTIPRMTTQYFFQFHWEKVHFICRFSIVFSYPGQKLRRQQWRHALWRNMLVPEVNAELYWKCLPIPTNFTFWRWKTKKISSGHSGDLFSIASR